VHVKLEREEQMNTTLKTAREKSGMTQAQIAKQIGVTERAYQYYEAAKKAPRVQTALRIAKTLDSTVEDLFDTADKT